ncbi:MAG: protein-S-isoprenylcysteine O-methyltransferase [Anaerolineales bacterium]
MDIYTVVFFLAIVAETVIRVPVNQKRKAEKKIVRQVTGKEKSMLFLLWGGMVILPIIYAATNWLDFANYTLPTWAGWFGVFLIFMSVLAFWRAHVDLGLNWSPTLEIREKHTLVTRGIYSMIRHPMYASQLIWSLAQILLLQNWIVGFSSLAVFFPFYFMRVPAEEQLMLEQFGDQYRSYKQKVGAVFPKL